MEKYCTQLGEDRSDPYLTRQQKNRAQSALKYLTRKYHLDRSPEDENRRSLNISTQPFSDWMKQQVQVSYKTPPFAQWKAQWEELTAKFDSQQDYVGFLKEFVMEIWLEMTDPEEKKG